jgi:hypothetical protein
LIVTGYRDDNDTRFYVLTTVYSGYFKRYYVWNFLIDTGAARTQLSWNDADYYGIQIRYLPIDNRTFVGLGGKVQGYLLPQSELIFKSSTGVYKLVIGDLSVSDFMTTDGVQAPRNPSVLGIDILDKFDIYFTIRSNSVMLDRDIGR